MVLLVFFFGHLGGRANTSKYEFLFRQNSSMYAKNSPGETYHSLSQKQDKTMCGLSVVPIVIDRPVDTSGLHFTSNKPTNGEMCKDCARIEQEDNPATA